MTGWTILLGWDRPFRLGYESGLLPELRIGWLRISWCRGWIGHRVRAWRDALRQAARGIGA